MALAPFKFTHTPCSSLRDCSEWLSESMLAGVGKTQSWSPMKKRFIRILIWFGVLLTLGFGLLVILIMYPPLPEPPERDPSKVWKPAPMPPVFRCVLDEEPRMLVLQLLPNLWAAYRTDHLALRRVWRDGVRLRGAAYNRQHGPQPISTGPAYLHTSAMNPWSLVDSQGIREAVFQYRGHIRNDNKTTLMLEVRRPDQSVLTIHETPEVVFHESGTLGFKRTFSVEGARPDEQVRLAVNLTSLEAPQAYTTNGGLEMAKTSDQATLTLSSQSPTHWTIWLGLPEIAHHRGSDAEMSRGFEYMTASDCFSCHNVNDRTVGPSFIEIAETYQNQPDAVPLLADRIISGSAGVWGDAQMNPHPDLDPAHAEEMVRDIIRLASKETDFKDASMTASLIQKVRRSLYLWKTYFISSRRESEGRPGDLLPLKKLHPSFDLVKIRDDSFRPRVGALGRFPDGRIVLSTWDNRGSVFLLDPPDAEGETVMRVEEIASGLAEPLGIEIVDGVIYVLQKQELTRLVDEDSDGKIDRYEVVCNDWPVSDNFHEFSFGLLHRDGHFYASLGTAVAEGGASSKNQKEGRGSLIQIDPVTGISKIMANGLRTPNGLGLGVDEELFVTDNEGAWLPANKLIHLGEGDFYGFRGVDPKGTRDLHVTKAALLLPRDEISNSPSEPASLDVGPYQGQMIIGDATYGGLMRVFLEKVGGEYQGAAFRFSQGFEAGINRLLWSDEQSLILGGIGGGGGNWSQVGKLTYGLQMMTFNGNSTFEILSMRARPNGFELEFTEPLAKGSGESPSDYLMKDWHYVATEEYGGDKMDVRSLDVRRVELSDDRLKVILRVDGLKADRLVHLRLVDDAFKSRNERLLWTTEAWYTLNRIPAR